MTRPLSASYRPHGCDGQRVEPTFHLPRNARADKLLNFRSSGINVVELRPEPHIQARRATMQSAVFRHR
eukprot:6844446-Alexandrium_andersonii.AAC.1